MARRSPQDLFDHLGRTRFDKADNEPPSFGPAGDELPTISHFNRGIAAFSRNGRCPSVAEPSWLARGCVHTVGNGGGVVVLDAQTFPLTDTGHAHLRWMRRQLCALRITVMSHENPLRAAPGQSETADARPIVPTIRGA